MDWQDRLTGEEQEIERRWRYTAGPVQRDVYTLLRSLAAFRKLVEAKDKALERVSCDAAIQQAANPRDLPAILLATLRKVRAVLALTEADMEGQQNC